MDSYKYKVFILIFSILLTSCNQKKSPIIKIDNNLSIPIRCLSIDKIDIDKKFLAKLNKLYNFNNNCKYKLYIKYKTDIVCNSPYNPNQKNLSSFPTSFLNLEIRDGLKLKYSYYIDLNDNVNEDDIKDAFIKVKKDLGLK